MSDLLYFLIATIVFVIYYIMFNFFVFIIADDMLDINFLVAIACVLGAIPLSLFWFISLPLTIIIFITSCICGKIKSSLLRLAIKLYGNYIKADSLLINRGYDGNYIFNFYGNGEQKKHKYFNSSLGLPLEKVIELK